MNCLSTSSSSLYSFLKTSEDYSFTNGESQSSSGEESPNTAKHIAKPVLSDPFWNEKVVLNNDLEFSYQLPVKDMETVLREDREKLAVLQQFAEVGEQMRELFSDNEEFSDMAAMMLETEANTSCDDTTSAEESGAEYDPTSFRTRKYKKRKHLEKLNLFLEADAPFPLPDSPKLRLSTKTKYGSPSRSSLGRSSNISSAEDWISEGAREEAKPTSAEDKMSEKSTGDDSRDNADAQDVADEARITAAGDSREVPDITDDSRDPTENKDGELKDETEAGASRGSEGAELPSSKRPKNDVATPPHQKTEN